MPAGIVIILILTVLIVFGYGNSICACFSLSKSGALLLFLGLTVSYMVNPLYLEGVTAYWIPFVIILFFTVKLLFKLKYPFRSIFLGTVSSALLFLAAQKILPQPIGLIYEPFFIYALIIAVINILFCYGGRSIIFNSAFTFLLFNTVMIFFEEYNNIMPPDAFSAICISGLISYYPVSVLSRKQLTLKYQRAFQQEINDELIFKKRK